MVFQTIEQEYRRKKFGDYNTPYNSNSALNPSTSAGKVAKAGSTIVGGISSVIEGGTNPISWGLDQATSRLNRGPVNSALDKAGIGGVYRGAKSVISTLVPFVGAALNTAEAVGSAFADSNGNL